MIISSSWLKLKPKIELKRKEKSIWICFLNDFFLISATRFNENQEIEINEQDMSVFIRIYDKLIVLFDFHVIFFLFV